MRGECEEGERRGKEGERSGGRGGSGEESKRRESLKPLLNWVPSGDETTRWVD